MSNQLDHRAPKNKRNKRHKERPVPATSTSGEGKRGTLGRSKWKRLQARNERRNLKQGREASIPKRVKKTKELPERTIMYSGIEIETGGIRRKNLMPRPTPSGLDPVE